MKRESMIFALGVAGVFLGAGVLGVLLAQRAAQGGLSAVDAWMSGPRTWGWVIRLGIAAIVVGGWPWWIARIARRERWPEPRAAAMVAWRWWVLGWFAAYEIIFVQNAFGILVRWLAR